MPGSLIQRSNASGSHGRPPNSATSSIGFGSQPEDSPYTSSAGTATDALSTRIPTPMANKPQSRCIVRVVPRDRPGGREAARRVCPCRRGDRAQPLVRSSELRGAASASGSVQTATAQRLPAVRGGDAAVARSIARRRLGCPTAGEALDRIFNAVGGEVQGVTMRACRPRAGVNCAAGRRLGRRGRSALRERRCRRLGRSGRRARPSVAALPAG